MKNSRLNYPAFAVLLSEPQTPGTFTPSRAPKPWQFPVFCLGFGEPLARSLTHDTWAARYRAPFLPFLSLPSKASQILELLEPLRSNLTSRRTSYSVQSDALTQVKVQERLKRAA
jgi:hypothetical protein